MLSKSGGSLVIYLMILWLMSLSKDDHTPTSQPITNQMTSVTRTRAQCVTFVIAQDNQSLLFSAIQPTTTPALL